MENSSYIGSHVAKYGRFRTNYTLGKYLEKPFLSPGTPTKLRKSLKIQVLRISYQDKIYLGIEEKQGSEAEDSIGPHPGRPVRLWSLEP